jgi:CBS domain-containing protein
MRTEPLLCTPLTSIENIQKLIAENGVDEILIVDTLLEKHLIGVINTKDIEVKSADQDVDPFSLNAEQCMRDLPITARETATLEECLILMDKYHVNHLPIIDKEGHLCGVYDSKNPIRQ